MRAVNIVIISIVVAFALLLLCVALPTFGYRSNGAWALTVGASFTVLVTSLIYLLLQILTPAISGKLNAIILATYLPAVVLSVISGSFWSVVGHVMDTEGSGFTAALPAAFASLVASYSLTMILIFCSSLYVISRVRSLRAERRAL